MKIGIIVHSHTGNTYSVAQKLLEKLKAAGHEVNIEEIIPLDSKQTEVAKIQLQAVHDISPYDALVFGAPVRGGSISPFMAAYLPQLSALSDKKIACFVTQFFPYPWMGGNRAIAQMVKICETKGGVVCETGIVNWKNKRREEMITGLVEKLGVMFG